MRRRRITGRTFAEIEAKIAALPTQHERGEAFERFAIANLARDPRNRHVWPLTTVPQPIRRRLGIDTRDMGIDAVVETYANGLVAVQVKFRIARASLSWRELSTFFGLSDRAAQKLVFTNATRVADVARARTHATVIAGYDLDRLSPPECRALTAAMSGKRPPPPEHRRPRTHQRRALTFLKRELRVRDRAMVVLPCGAGKTLVAHWASEHARHTLVLVPSLALMAQLMREWLTEIRTPVRTMAICSDPTVAGADAPVVRPGDSPVPVTTDSAEIRRHLGRRSTVRQLVFCTYQSAPVLARALPRDFRFDMGVFDEAHKTAGKQGRAFTLALDDDGIPIRKRVFFTATPRHAKVRRGGEDDENVVYSMDDEAMYGRRHTLTFRQAVEQKIIAPLKVLVSTTTRADVDAECVRRGETRVATDLVRTQQVAHQLAIAEAIRTHGASKIFTFHGTINAAASFVADGPEGVANHIPDLSTFHVTGAMPASQREQELRAFANVTPALISNARCLTEGVDVPAVNLVAFLHKKRSLIDIVQATGRAMRPAPGKPYGYVLVPLFIEQATGESLIDAIERAGQETLWATLHALTEVDDVLADEIRALAAEKAINGVIDGALESIEVLGPSVSLGMLREAITTKLVERLSAPWDMRYAELSEFKRRHGHVNVPRRPLTMLRRWLTVQGVFYRAGTLADDRVARLKVLGVVFGGTRVATWYQHFQAWLLHRKAHGADPRFGNGGSRGLSHWISYQRQLKRRGELPIDREQMLTKAGFAWVANTPDVAPHVKTVRDYYAAHGTTRPPTTGAAAVYNSYRALQRFAEAGHLSAADRRLFEKVAGLWFSPEATAAHRRAQTEQTLSKILIKVGAVRAAGKTVRKSDPLYRNMHSVRAYLRDDSPTKSFAAHARREGILPAGATGAQQRWLSQLSELVAYRKARGDEPPWRTRLGTWVMRQRTKRRQGELSDAMIEQLDAVGFPWEPPRTVK